MDTKDTKEKRKVEIELARSSLEAVAGGITALLNQSVVDRLTIVTPEVDIVFILHQEPPQGSKITYVRQDWEKIIMDYAFSCRDELNKYVDWKDAPLGFLHGAMPVVTLGELKAHGMDYQSISHYRDLTGQLSYNDWIRHQKTLFPHLYDKEKNIKAKPRQRHQLGSRLH